jgi:hypothetical protein
MMYAGNDNPDLDRALAALKAATCDQAPPPAVDTAIARAIARASTRRRFVLAWKPRWMLAPAAIAAAVGVVFIAYRSALDPVRDELPAATARPATQFMPVVPMAELEQSPTALIVPARLPRMSLAELGLPVSPERAADAIDAELLVRPDGTLLAVRFAY